MDLHAKVLVIAALALVACVAVVLMVLQSPEFRTFASGWYQGIQGP